MGATLSTLLALLLTEPSPAHVDVRPRLVELGAVADLQIELPRLRAGPPPVRLEVEGDQVEVLATRLQAAAAAETLWSVRLRVGPNAHPGEVLLVLRAVFADGETVEVDGSIAVLPPALEPSGSIPWLGVLVGGVLALTAAVAALLLLRRRR